MYFRKRGISEDVRFICSPMGTSYGERGIGPGGREGLLVLNW